MELLSIIFVFGLCPLRADEHEKLVDVRDILKNADAALFQNSVTKVTSEQASSDKKGKWVLTSYYFKNNENEDFAYQKSTLKTDRTTHSNIMIKRPDGNWSLYSGVAIHQPDYDQTHDIAIYHDSKPVLGTVKDCLDNEVPCLRIEITPSINGQGISAQGIQEQIIYRYEFLISKLSGMIILRRGYSKDGKVILQGRITSVEKNCDIPLSIFEIPKDYKILFPGNQSENLSLIRKYDRLPTQTKKQPNRSNTNNQSGEQQPDDNQQQ